MLLLGNRLIKNIVAGILIAIVMQSCGGTDIPSDVLPPEKFSRVMWDMMRADEMTVEARAADTGVNIETYAEKLYLQVFAIHQTTKEEFKRSFDYYQGRPDLSKILFDTLINRGNRGRQERMGRQDSIAEAQHNSASGVIDSTVKTGGIDTVLSQTGDSAVKEIKLIQKNRNSSKRGGLQ
jgi:hypothetical protein